MAIVCGTDFSEHAHGAASIGAALARCFDEPLVLVHVRETVTWRTVIGSDWPEFLLRFQAQLEAEAADLRTWRITVETEMLAGLPDEELVAYASRRNARLVILGSHGRRSPARWLCGSVAEHVAAMAPVPVLVARQPAPFVAWLHEGGAPPVMVGIDFTHASEAAAAWAQQLVRRSGAPLVVAHLYEQTEELDRQTADAAGSGGHAEVEAELRRRIETTFGPWLSGVAHRIVLRPTDGAVAEALAEIAAEERAGLLIVGTHQRSGVSRLWQGSVSHAAIQVTGTSVLCVPAP